MFTKCGYLKDFLFNSVDTGRKLNVHKTFRRHPGRKLNVHKTYIFYVYRKKYTNADLKISLYVCVHIKTTP